MCSVESEKKEEKGRLFLFPMSGFLFERKKEREREEKEKNITESSFPKLELFGESQI